MKPKAINAEPQPVSLPGERTLHIGVFSDDGDNWEYGYEGYSDDIKLSTNLSRDRCVANLIDIDADSRVDALEVEMPLVSQLMEFAVARKLGQILALRPVLIDPAQEF